MRHILLTIAAAAVLTLRAAVSAAAQSPDYDTYFTTDRLRVDFILAGNAQEQHAYLAGLKKECAWAGSHASLIDPFRYGEYMFEAWSGETLRILHPLPGVEDYRRGRQGIKGLHTGRVDALPQGRDTYFPLRESKGHR